MDKVLMDVYRKLAAAEEQVKAGKTIDAAEGLQALREKLRLTTERLALKRGNCRKSAEGLD